MLSHSLSIGMFSLAVLLAAPASHAQEIKLTQATAQDLIQAYAQQWSRCLNIPAESVFGGFNANNPLLKKKIVRDLCLSDKFDGLFQACLVTSSRFQDDMIELEIRKVIQQSKRDNRDFVYTVKNNLSNDGYYASEGGALCGHFPNTGYATQITRIEQTTDVRWEVSYSLWQTSNDRYFSQKLTKQRIRDKKAIEYQNGQFVVQDN
jgi:hypothetical protein